MDPGAEGPRSGVLSALQTRIASIVSELPQAAELALAGGAALIITGAVARTTRDLDFFAADPGAIARVLPALEAALAEAGLDVRQVQVSEGFVRLEVGGSDDRTQVDLCYDTRLLPAEPGPLGPVLAGEELAANKLLALFTRAEARDFIDVHVLSRRYGFDRLCELAHVKDPGFHAAALGDALAAFARLPRQAFEVDDAVLEEMARDVAEWRARVLARSLGSMLDRPQPPSQELEGPDLGP